MTDDADRRTGIVGERWDSVEEYEAKWSAWDGSTETSLRRQVLTAGAQAIWNVIEIGEV
jgi:hypothetical protein